MLHGRLLKGYGLSNAWQKARGARPSAPPSFSREFGSCLPPRTGDQTWMSKIDGDAFAGPSERCRRLTGLHPFGRKLQHGCPLTFAQAGERHDPAARELQRVVMRQRLVEIDLRELGNPFRQDFCRSAAIARAHADIA